MIKKIFISICALGAFFSCSMENEMRSVTDNVSQETTEQSADLRKSKNDPDFKVKDGYLKFKTKEDLLLAYELLSGKSQKELIAWSEENGYTSLLSAYAKEDSIFMSTFVPTRDYEPGEVLPYQAERMSSLALSTLYNKDGIIIVNDTIFQVRGMDVYIIEKEDFNKAKKVKEASDIKSVNNIPHYKHTIKYHNEPAITTRAATVTNYDACDGKRSYVINVTSKRREFVEFHVDAVGIHPTLPAYNVETKMIGQAQTKSALIWWPNFDDEIYVGNITINSVNGVNPYLTPGAGSNAVTIYGPPLLGFSGLSTYTNKIVITFKIKKNANFPDEIYVNTYYR